MRKITLIEGVKDSGKSLWIKQKFNSVVNQCKTLEIINKGDFNTVIYVLEDRVSKDIMILNSGSDNHNIIYGFEKIVSKYPTADIFTAIRPKRANPNLHKWMKDALHIIPTDTIAVVLLS